MTDHTRGSQLFPDELPWANLGRWFAGEMSVDEAAALERWVADDPERTALVAAMREAWIASGAVGQGWDPTAALRRVREATASEARVIARFDTGPAAAPAGARRRVRSMLQVAAALVLVASGALFLDRAVRDASIPTHAAMAVYRTPRGQRLAIRLPDGTQVTLAPGSVLRRPQDYGRRERRLELDGEAYFVVTHDRARPFTVHTNRLVARDLGTRFNVRAYHDEPATEVVVAEGEVAVDTLVLARGERGRVDARGTLTHDRNVPLDRILAWTDGKLAFRDTPLVEVERQLERWYDVDVRLRSPDLGRLRVTGTFGDEPVTEVLASVAHSLNLSARRIGRGYELAHNRR